MDDKQPATYMQKQEKGKCVDRDNKAEDLLW